ncbi:MAG TPA: acyl-CoA dehydrogenase [Pseudomonadota bacterium]|nr:acyl-CoA dehydrogenase [Pseudomonadota bacterium]
MANPLVSDRDVEFLLYEVLDGAALPTLPAFAAHDRATFELLIDSARRLAREVLYPAYRAMDAEPPRFEDGRIITHPLMKTIYPQLVEFGLIGATRPVAVGGQQLPRLVCTLAAIYLMAGNLSACGYVGLTSAAAHLLESFGSEELKREFMARMYSGQWTGTMALTEPQAGSSLADVKTRATPAAGGHYLIRGSKIFISAGDHDLTENVVHLTLARIDGAPAGVRGISLFAVPRRRREGEQLVDNDVSVAGMIHKIGWRGLPSLALEFGEGEDCHGWLVGEPGRGLACMFQMMNEARLMVGANGVATASVAYHEAVSYARERPQGRPLTKKTSAQGLGEPQVPIVEHADVRRMLLRQKAIVEGGLSLIAATAYQADLAEHASTEAERKRAALLLDLLTPVAKSFPAERGFEANALALQVHGGYGYSSEFLPEAWLRDQKLNSIHEGTTGIQGLDLLGRKVMAQGGGALQLLAQEIGQTIERARGVGVAPAWIEPLDSAVQTVGQLTMQLAQKGLAGEVEAMLLHSADYLELFSILIVGWQWLLQAAVARGRLSEEATRPLPPADRDFYEGKLCAAQYWLLTEVPRITTLAALCASGEDSYGRMRAEWF